MMGIDRAMRLASVSSLISTNPVQFKRLMWQLVKWCSGPVLLLIIGALLVFKYYRDKRIKIICHQNQRNQEILKTINGLIKSYSPTIYLPFSMLKVVMLATDKMAILDDYLRMDFKLSDGESIPLDWFPRHYKSMNPTTPIVIFIPGTFGTSYDRYSLEFCKSLYEKLGWRSFVLNRRGFASQIRSGNVITYRNYSDWLEILDYLHKVYPQSDVYIAGVSMGALNVQRFLAEYGESCNIRGAVTISSPFDVNKTMAAIDQNLLIGKAFRQTMVEMFRIQLAHEEFTKLCETKGINTDKVLTCKTIEEFGMFVTAIDHGVSHPNEYFENLSTHKLAKEISIPLLSINSEDDPIVHPSLVPVDDIVQNPNIIQLMVAGGGHIEYFHGLKRQLVSFLLTLVGI